MARTTSCRSRRAARRPAPVPSASASRSRSRSSRRSWRASPARQEARRRRREPGRRRGEPPPGPPCAPLADSRPPSLRRGPGLRPGPGPRPLASPAFRALPSAPGSWPRPSGRGPFSPCLPGLALAQPILAPTPGGARGRASSRARPPACPRRTARRRPPPPRASAQRLEVGADLRLELPALLGRARARRRPSSTGSCPAACVSRMASAASWSFRAASFLPRRASRAMRSSSPFELRRPRRPGRPCARAAAPGRRRSLARALPRELLLGLRGDPLLRPRQLLRLAQRVLHALLERGPSALALQPAARVAQSLERGRALARRSARGRPCLERFMALAASCSRRAVSCMAGDDCLAGQALEPPGQLLGLARQVALRAAAAAAAAGSAAARPAAARARSPAPGGGPARAAAPAPRPPCRPPSPATPRWTVSYWFFSLSSSSSNRSARSSAFMAEPPPPRAALLEAHLDVAEGGLRALQVLEGGLLGRQRLLGLASLQLCSRAEPISAAAERSDCAVLSKSEPGSSTPRFAMRCTSDCTCCLQPALREGQHAEVLAVLLVRDAAPVAHELEGGGDDLALLEGERVVRAAAPAAARRRRAARPAGTRARRGAPP